MLITPRTDDGDSALMLGRGYGCAAPGFTAR